MTLPGAVHDSSCLRKVEKLFRDNEDSVGNPKKGLGSGVKMQTTDPGEKSMTKPFGLKTTSSRMDTFKVRSRRHHV